jgi:hypothetical protein
MTQKILTNNKSVQLIQTINQGLVGADGSRLATNNQDDTLANDKGMMAGSCNRTACQAPQSAFYYNKSTQKFYCASCAKLINDANRADAMRLYNSELCVKIYAPIDVYDDGTVLIASYNDTNVRYCIDMSTASLDTDRYLMVHHGEYMDFENPKLVQPDQYQEVIDHIKKQCLYLIDYTEVTAEGRDRVLALTTICDQVCTILTMLGSEPQDSPLV